MSNRGNVVKKILPLCLMVWLALTLMGFSLSYAAPEASEKKILILYADTPAFLPYTIFTDAFKSRIAEIDNDKISYYYEYLAWSQHATDPTYAGDVSVFLHQKYRKDKPNLVILVGGSAAQFFLLYGERMFPGVPKVIVGVTGVGYSKINIPQNFSVLQSLYDESKIIETILQIQPATKRIYVLIGDSAAEKRTVTSYSLNFKRFVDKVEIIYLNQLPFNKLLEFVPTVKGDAVFLFHVFFQDVEGRAFVPSNVLRRIYQVARVPIYGVQDTFLGAGSVGGYVNSIRLMGLRTAEQMASMRAGNKPAGSAQIATSTGEYVFDWRELKRWGIAVDRLPVGSRIEFGKPSVWEMYKWLILGIVFIIIMQGTLILGLVVNSVKRKKATNELLRSKEALRNSESKYQFLAESMADVVFTLDINLVTTYVSPSIERMLGFTPEERMVQKVDQQLTPKSQEWVFETLVAELDREKEKGSDPDRSQTLELEYYHKDGSIKHLVTYIRGIRDSQGILTGFYGSHHDITDRKRAEEALRKSEELLRLITDNMSDMIRVADLKGVNLFTSPSHFKGLGYKPEERVGKSAFDIVHPDDLEKVIKAFSEGLAANRPVSLEYRVRHADGHYVWLETVGDLLRDAQGKTTAVVMSSRDITERKRAEEEKRSLEERLKRAEKMEALGQLAGGVAHDLNNVLGVLSGYSELLLLETPKGHRSRGHAEKILQSTEKGAAIIDDLLTLARRGVVVSDVISLNSLVSDFIKTPVFESMKDYHPRVTFRTEYDKNLLNIKGSPVHLEKTLMNLISNAAESISGSGIVTIQTESRYLDKPLLRYDEVREGDYAVITVSDTGMGIPAENREKIFEPFYTKKTMGRSGTGLGLAIVWGTVKDHNGYIDVQTEVGEGTTFTLYFPVTREEMVLPQQKETMERYMGKGESVLVVDDIAEQREVASGLLTRLGYEVHVVSSGEEAVAYLKGNKADILVLDMIMPPGIDGLETYQRVLGINPKQKAIIVSGFSETERVKEAQKLGAGAYVKKPYIMEKIGGAIRNELNR